MTLETMYPVVVGGGTTTLTEGFTAGTSTTIKVTDASGFPSAPNYVTVVSSDNMYCITLKYGSLSNNEFSNLTIVEYSPSGNTHSYVTNDIAIRSVCKADIDAIQSNITSVNSSISTHEADTTIHVTSSEKSTWTNKQNAITSENELSADLVDDSNATNKFNVQSDWTSDSGLSQIQNRPFKTIGTGLSVTNNILTADTQFKFQIFETLPTASQTYAQTIALIANSGSGSNIYDEYACVNTTNGWIWELIGTTTFTLSIVQNASGITINNTALQSATSAQKGLLSSTDWNTFNAKQSALTFDSTPTASSTNPVTSGGVYTALNGKQDTATNSTGTLTVAGWDSTTKTQTISVSGVTASNTVIVSPAPASVTDYGASGIYCSAQGAGTLTFTYKDVPFSAITINAVIL